MLYSVLKRFYLLFKKLKVICYFEIIGTDVHWGLTKKKGTVGIQHLQWFKVRRLCQWKTTTTTGVQRDKWLTFPTKNIQQIQVSSQVMALEIVPENWYYNGNLLYVSEYSIMNQNRASKYFPVQPDRPLGFLHVPIWKTKNIRRKRRQTKY